MSVGVVVPRCRGFIIVHIFRHRRRVTISVFTTTITSCCSLVREHTYTNTNPVLPVSCLSPSLYCIPFGWALPLSRRPRSRLLTVEGMKPGGFATSSDVLFTRVLRALRMCRSSCRLHRPDPRHGTLLRPRDRLSLEPAANWHTACKQAWGYLMGVSSLPGPRHVAAAAWPWKWE